MAQALLDRPGQLSRLILQQQPDVETPPLATVAGGALRLRTPGSRLGRSGRWITVPADS
jgi:hypothetical protein